MMIDREAIYAKTAKYLVLIPAHRNVPPTRAEFFKKWEDTTIEYMPEEIIETLSFEDQQTLAQVYIKLVCFVWVNFDDWGAQEVRRVCNELNTHVLKPYGFVCIADKHSYADKEEWENAKKVFRFNVKEAFDKTGIAQV